MAVKVKKIVLEINDKKIELSVEEAKELQKLLGDTLGRDVHYHYTYPIYVERPHYPYWTVSSGGSGTITYTSTSGSNLLPPEGITVTS